MALQNLPAACLLILAMGVELLVASLPCFIQGLILINKMPPKHLKNMFKGSVFFK
jgi:hypothetical protein